MAQLNSFRVLLVLIFFSTSTAYNIVDFGAKPDGRTDSSKAFLSAWAAACGSKSPASITVPPGKFFLSQALFQGPCNNNVIQITLSGTMVAPIGKRTSKSWIIFKYVQGVSIYGGTLDGQGQSFWDCKLAKRGCVSGATSLLIADSKDVVVSGMTLLNSQGVHMTIFGSSSVTVSRSNFTAPEHSPNTDGIHMSKSSNITISGTTFQTGDDCISLCEGTTNVWIEEIGCGPGHGISIGSLGGNPSESGVQNITVKSAVFTGTQNGLRIKTWGKPNTGFVRDVKFQHAVMNNVRNPIFVDQNYCPGAVNCPGQKSGIKISQVRFIDVQGTSATPVAVKLDCSPSNPCSGIELQDIKLLYENKPAQSFCKFAQGSASGFVIPNCL